MSESIDENFIKKVRSMSKEEREKYFLSLPREKAAAYKEIFMRVVMLEDFYPILSNTPKESFKNEFNISIKNVGENPADILKDYIILEIRKFHQLSHHEKKIKGVELPPVPEYWTKIRDIRDARIAHPSKRNEFKSNKDVEKLYRPIDEIGLDKIVEEFKQYAQECIGLVNKSEFYDDALQNLKNMMEEGKIELLDDEDLKQSLRNIKTRPDGSIIESSVNGTIRALLLAIEASKGKLERDENE